MSFTAASYATENNHREALVKRHKALSQKIEELYKFHPSSSDVELRTLKRQRLRIKELINNIRKERKSVS